MPKKSPWVTTHDVVSRRQHSCPWSVVRDEASRSGHDLTGLPDCPAPIIFAGQPHVLSEIPDSKRPRDHKHFCSQGCLDAFVEYAEQSRAEVRLR